MTSDTQTTLPVGDELINRLETVVAELSAQSDGYGDRVELMAALQRFVSRHGSTVDGHELGDIHIEHALFRYGLSGENCYDELSDHFTDPQIRTLVDTLELFADRADLCWVCEDSTDTTTVSTDEPAGAAVVDKLVEDHDAVTLCPDCVETVREQGWHPDESERIDTQVYRRRRW
jgi:hypothetical protein